MRIVVLDSFPADQGAPGWQALSQLGEMVAAPAHPRRPSVLERAAGAEAVITNKVVLDADTLARLPQLRYIGVCATGTNVVDLAAARQRGIAVTNVPGYAAESVAQTVFAAALHFAHDVAAHGAAVKAGDWARSPDFCFFRKPLFELAGKRLVHPRSGRHRPRGGPHRRAASAWRWSRRRSRAARPAPTGSTWPRSCPRADVVSLHCPLTPATEQAGRRRLPGPPARPRHADQHQPRRPDRRDRRCWPACAPATWAAWPWTCSPRSPPPPITR